VYRVRWVLYECTIQYERTRYGRSTARLSEPSESSEIGTYTPRLYSVGLWARGWPFFSFLQAAVPKRSERVCEREAKRIVCVPIYAIHNAKQTIWAVLKRVPRQLLPAKLKRERRPSQALGVQLVGFR